MNYILLPSLQEAAVVRIASLLYSDCEIENTIRYEKNVRRRRELIEIKTSQKLSSLLPSTLREKVAKVIHPMHKEVRRWKIDHEFLLEHIGGCCCTHLCWRTDGTINRTETAKKLVTIVHIDPKIRFVLACTYFLEDEIVALWERYEKIEKHTRCCLHDTNIAVRFWMERLKKKDSNPWSEMIDEYVRNRSFYPMHIRPRASCYYHLLSRESKQKILYFLASPYHSDDLQKCVNRMNETERIEIFHSIPYDVLDHCFIRWPFRSLFLRMSKEVIGHLTAEDIVLLLLGMLHAYFFDGDDDFEIFETFWQICPPAFKDEARKDECFIIRIKKCLENEDLPQDFKETLRLCLY